MQPGMQQAYPPPTVDGHRPPAVAPPIPRSLQFSFTGNASEYFRIWIVNVMLSVITLGIYSAWAKVRTRQYFYRHTWVDGSSFEYLADPVRILKGRVVVATAIAAVFAAQYYSLALYVVLAIALALATPWAVTKSLAFNAHNSAFRNVRFSFQANTGEAYGVYVLAALIYVLSFGMGYPFAQWRITQFAVSRHLFGDEPLRWDTTTGEYFKVYLISLAMSTGIVIFAVINVVIGALVLHDVEGFSEVPPTAFAIGIAALYALMVIPLAYNRANIANALYSGITVSSHRLISEQEFLPILKLYVTNFLGVVFSLGLLTPWAKVRLAAYRAERMKLLAVGPLEGRRYEFANRANALGDAAMDLGDMDFDLGL